MAEEGMEESSEGMEERVPGERGQRGIRIKPSYFLQKPVKVGDEVEVTIEAVASKGDGIAKINGFVIFVKGAKQGDKLKVKITEVKARFGIGEPAVA
jgi:23S rRNA (uridine2552-2'-O)-methyltransferase